MTKDTDKEKKASVKTHGSGSGEKDLLEDLGEENKVLSQLVKSLEEKVLRSQADVENIRKSSQKEILKSRLFSAETITRELLTPVDNLQRALDHSEDGIPASLIELVLKEIAQALSKNNVEEINPLGEKFDPNFHEALSIQKEKKKEPDEILEVIQKGYKIQDRIIRPALVIVNKI
jgi:molecular chaperone GrpE